MEASARLTDIDLDEALRYLGCRDARAPEGTREALAQCALDVREAARPAAVWRLFELDEDGALIGADFRPMSEDVRERLRGCTGVVLLGATLGAQVDALIRRAQVRDMARAVMLDACAGAAVENVVDNLCRDIAGRVAPRFLTPRFSPGYGDMPLRLQAELFRALDVTRRIGVSLTPGGLMVPQKSVTALAGVSPVPAAARGEGCRGCSLFSTCAYRKEGKRCEAH